MNRTTKKDFFKYLDRTINPEARKSENKGSEIRQPSRYTHEKGRKDNFASVSRKHSDEVRCTETKQIKKEP